MFHSHMIGVILFADDLTFSGADFVFVDDIFLQRWVKKPYLVPTDNCLD